LVFLKLSYGFILLLFGDFASFRHPLLKIVKILLKSTDYFIVVWARKRIHLVKPTVVKRKVHYHWWFKVISIKLISYFRIGNAALERMSFNKEIMKCTDVKDNIIKVTLCWRLNTSIKYFNASFMLFVYKLSDIFWQYSQSCNTFVVDEHQYFNRKLALLATFIIIQML
jgi:hypothetical protein